MAKGIKGHLQKRGFGATKAKDIHPKNTNGNFSSYGSPDVANITPNNTVRGRNPGESKRMGGAPRAQNSKKPPTSHPGHPSVGAQNVKDTMRVNTKVGLGSGTGKGPVKKMGSGKKWK